MHASRNLLGQSRFLGIWINISYTAYKRRASQGKLFKILLQNTLKTTFQVRIEPIINPQMHINRQIFSKIMAFLSSFNKDRGYLPPPHLLVARLNQFIFLNNFFFFMAISRFSKASLLTLKRMASHCQQLPHWFNL